ncbi:hypothetical protein N6P31_06600 [Pectobacterium betavasculorum]|uniref:DUF6602 domain-containing protein n=1 Tax=Pectobacterium betavasculorum TaxID=55207 RepID=UPI00313E9F07
MPQNKNHDLHNFMQQLSTEMANEYQRIQMRASEDPGTAGDQGEENWAELLRDWLPRTYEVVTKGRIISEKGETSPQIDVIVLNESYPKKLLNKKLYLAAGVYAAFECKTTLKSSHITEAVNNCKKIKNLYPVRIGSPYKELHTPIIYGLLAHSHSWKGEKSTPETNIEQKINEADEEIISHPREQLDLLCVADLATWASSKMTITGPNLSTDWPQMAPFQGQNGSVNTSYIGHTLKNEQFDQFTSIGVLISYLSQRIAWENTSLRSLSDYYRIANIAGNGRGYIRKWPLTVFSNEIRPRVEAGLSNGKWNEWGMVF